MRLHTVLGKVKPFQRAPSSQEPDQFRDLQCHTAVQNSRCDVSTNGEIKMLEGHKIDKAHTTWGGVGDGGSWAQTTTVWQSFINL